MGLLRFWAVRSRKTEDPAQAGSSGYGDEAIHQGARGMPNAVRAATMAGAITGPATGWPPGCA